MHPLLVVEDDALARNTLLRVLQPFGAIACANDVASALVILELQELSGLVTDLDLAGRHEGGFEIIDAARLLEKHAGLPVVVVTGSREAWAINGAGARGAMLLAKPDYAVATLMPFFDRVAVRDAGVAKLGDAIVSAATSWGLTRRERQLLPWLVSRLGEKQMCELAGSLSANVRETAARPKFSVEGEQSSSREFINQLSPCSTPPDGSDGEGQATEVHRRVQEADPQGSRRVRSG